MQTDSRLAGVLERYTKAVARLAEALHERELIDQKIRHLSELIETHERYQEVVLNNKNADGKSVKSPSRPDIHKGILEILSKYPAGKWVPRECIRLPFGDSYRSRLKKMIAAGEVEVECSGKSVRLTQQGFDMARRSGVP